MESTRRPNRLRIATFVVFAAAMIVGFLLLRDKLSLDNLAQQELAWQNFSQRHFLFCLVAFGLLYVTVSALSLPFATVLTVTCGRFFGFWVALPLVNLSATLGATASFLMSRYLFRDFVEHRYGTYLQRVQDELARDGVLYLFMLRLTPVMPFFIVNPVMGLTKMRIRSFFVVSMVGMLPGGCLYAAFGSLLPSLAQLKEKGLSAAVSPFLLVSFAMLGVFPLVVKKLVTWTKRGASQQ